MTLVALEKEWQINVSSSKSCGTLTLHRAHATRRKTESVTRFLNQERRCDLKSSLSSVTEPHDKKRLASHSDSTIGFLGSDLAAPKMHCSTTIIWRQEACRKPGDQGKVYGVHITDAEDVAGTRARARAFRAHFHNGLGTYYRTYVRIYMRAQVTNRCIIRRMHLARVTYHSTRFGLV